MFQSLKEAIRACCGEGREILSRQPVYGGDINEAVCLHLSGGDKLFLKKNSIGNVGFFRAEEAGLAAIKATGAIPVPRIYGYGIDRKEGFSFLLMEYIEAHGKAGDYWQGMGRNLARMHLADTKGLSGDPDKAYGFPEDNYIGASSQVNRPAGTWIDFFREARLEPQIRMAGRNFNSGQRKKLISLLDQLDRLLIEPERPSLLHGDLWGGNVICGSDGQAWLIDPAVYVGHREADLAMTQLFGGFPASFYRAYEDQYPMDPGYEDRRDLYNLYHLLNHLNLFGRGYLASVVNILNRYI